MKPTVRLLQIYKSNLNNPSGSMTGCKQVFDYFGSYAYYKSKYAGQLHSAITLKELGDQIGKDFSKAIKEKLDNVMYYRQKMLSCH